MSIKNEITEKGYAEIASGVYLQSSENLIADQAGWDDEDSAKDMDFTIYPFWVTTDDGVTPEGFESIDAATKKHGTIKTIFGS